ncbi:short chain dehydrogenase [Colletotrichum navitas]|uniref:Short chain dehydrogenase n=1 Tax=Colletotrichum navitas TaxID=681940 RepID=A0AAD8V1K8_9PEZI|nr:short chain dehydrogenase [Colletotrichum navitas]KAK1574424.1 short chain dehydrogenase [Colletotrichum navitas]
MSTGQKTSGPQGNDLFTRDHLFDLTGKVALVTGGATGIGLMATQALAANGARVYIVSRNQDKLDNATETYSQNVAGEIIPLQADVTSKADIDRLFGEIESREGGLLDVLVNNAGVSSGPVEVESSGADDMASALFRSDSSTFDDWTSTYRTNVAALFYVAARALPLLQKSSDARPGWSGTMINISSISGMIKKSQHHFSYNASKAAAIHVNRMLAEEVAANGLKVRVNSIAPGVFPSEMTTKEPADEEQKSAIPKSKYADKVPAGRPGKDEDMAATVLFFACNQYLNGQTLAVDGGYTLAAGL